MRRIRLAPPIRRLAHTARTILMYACGIYQDACHDACHDARTPCRHVVCVAIATLSSPDSGSVLSMNSGKEFRWTRTGRRLAAAMRTVATRPGPLLPRTLFPDNLVQGRRRRRHSDEGGATRPASEVVRG